MNCRNFRYFTFLNAFKRVPASPRAHLRSTTSSGQTIVSARTLHSSLSLHVIKPFLLADIGEGITECQVIQWFVKPGARVEQFDKLCEVQSDKASVEITSRFDGVIKKLYYEADDMAIVGKPLVDIDIQSEIAPEDEALTTPPAQQAGDSESAQQPQKVLEKQREGSTKDAGESSVDARSPPPPESQRPIEHRTLATPAVRHQTKKHGINIGDVAGTGKDGRVLKEDVQRHAASSAGGSAPASPASPEQATEDKTIQLTPVQTQMFKTMTRSLSIPHFLYTDTIDLTNLSQSRRNLNLPSPRDPNSVGEQPVKLSTLPFVIKAISLSLRTYPILNARIDITTNPQKPQLVLRANHNIGVAVDTPQGLIVPVVKGVQNMSISAIASELRRLTTLAQAAKLSATDLTGGTITVSNVGSIGGGVVSPVIVEGQVGIVGIGRARTVPAFDKEGKVVGREEVVLSWSADHRVVDGATVARCAEMVKGFVEGPEGMLVRLR